MESDKFGIGAGSTLLLRAGPDRQGLLRAAARTIAAALGYGAALRPRRHRRLLPSDGRRTCCCGVDSLIARGLVDQDRLVLIGWSAGGTLVNKLVTDDGSVQGGFVGRRASPTGSRSTGRPTARRSGAPGSAARRGARMRRSSCSGTTRRSRTCRSVKTPTTVLRRRGRHAGAEGAVGRDVSRAQEPRRADRAADRAQRGTPVGRAARICCARRTPSSSGSRNTRTGRAYIMGESASSSHKLSCS